MAIYVTKYLFTSGILTYENAELCDRSTGDGQFARIKGTGGCIDKYFHGKDFHLTMEDAVKHALKMVDRKGKTLRKQTEQLRELKSRLRKLKPE